MFVDLLFGCLRLIGLGWFVLQSTNAGCCLLFVCGFIVFWLVRLIVLVLDVIFTWFLLFCVDFLLFVLVVGVFCWFTGSGGCGYC